VHGANEGQFPLIVQAGQVPLQHAQMSEYLTLRRLMSYIYIYIYVCVCVYIEHPFLMFLDHTQQRSTVGRTPLDE